MEVSLHFSLISGIQNVIDAINESYDARTYINGNTYEGITSDGLVIRMYLDQQDKIISAFLVY